MKYGKKKMKHLILVLLLSIMPFMLSAQINLPENIDQRVDTILRIIEKDSIVYLTKGVGIGGSRTVQYQLADHLKDNISSERLKQIALTHPSAVVRGAVFNALLRKDAHAAVEVAIEGIEDMTHFLSQSGCCIGDDTLSILRVHYIILNSKYYHVPEEDLERICEVVLYSNNVKRLDTYGHLYKVLKPKNEYYDRLKQLYDKVKYPEPLIALCKYGKEEDKMIVLDIIKSYTTKFDRLLSTALCAIVMNPDMRYKPYLQKLGNNFLTRKIEFPISLYAALMTIEEPWVVQMIDSSINDIRNDYKRANNRWNLYEAYSEHPVPYFKEVYDKHCKRYK